MSSVATSTSSSSSASVKAAYADQLGQIQPLPCCRQQLGPYLWRSDFDSGNLESITFAGEHSLESTFSANQISTPDIFHAYLSADPMSNYRVWFHFSVSGGQKGKPIHIIIKNLNNKKPLFGEGMHPICRLASQSTWKRCQGMEFTTLKTEKGVYSFLRPKDELTTGAATTMTNEDDENGEEQRDGSEDEEEEVSATAEVIASTSIASSPKASPSSSPTHSRNSSQSGVITIAAPAPKKKSTKPAAKPKIKHDTMELTIKHTFEVDNEELFFAFCLPYSYTQLQAQLLAYERKYSPTSAAASSIYFHRELLIHSLEGRRIDLVTISSQRGRSGEYEPSLPNLYPAPTAASVRSADIKAAFPHDNKSNSATAASSGSSLAPESRASAFAASKPVVFISARVHPGESPSSYLMIGLLEFILHPTDPRALALRENFVFKFIPFLNPDGVAHGYYRTDTLGQNLNRFYENPVLELQPSIYATRALIANYHERKSLYFYADLHAHAQKRGLFLFGNYLNDMTDHALNIAYAKLTQLNSPYLNMDACNFSKANMRAKDARDGLSKEGAGRVAFYTLTGLKHCYTCEVNYFNGRVINQISTLPTESTLNNNPTASTSSSTIPASATVGLSLNNNSDLSWQKDDYHLAQDSLIGPPVQYGASHFQSMGKSLLVSILDLAEKNPYSRLPTSEYINLHGIERWSKSYAMAPPKKIVKKLSKKPAKNVMTTKPSPSPDASPRE